MTYSAGCYDVAVIGAGHAGIEAALAAARLGCHTAIFTINMDAVGNCPCNPSIGGTAKGHLVRELDALGGEMGKTADECFLQSRMLNRGKGPAVHSLRAQIDRRKYADTMKHKLELQENLELRQAEITDINSSRMLSIDVIPVPTDEAVKEVEQRLLGVETNITNWQRKQNMNNNFSAVVPTTWSSRERNPRNFWMT